MTLRVAAMGPTPMMEGSTPPNAPATQVAMGVMPSSLALSSLMMTRAAAPSLMAEELPGGDDAVLHEGGLQLAQNLHRAQAGTFIGVEDDLGLLLLHGDGNDLVLEGTALDGGRRP